MAKAPTPAASTKSGPSRKRRNSLERKCMSKAFKRLYAGMPKSVQKNLLKAERDLKKKPTAV